MAAAGDRSLEIEGQTDPAQEMADYIDEVHLDALLPVEGSLREHLRRHAKGMEVDFADCTLDQALFKRVGCRERLRKTLKSASAILQDLDRPRRAAMLCRNRLVAAGRMMFRETLLTGWIRSRLRRPREDQDERVEVYREVMKWVVEAQAAFEDIGENYPLLFESGYPLDAATEEEDEKTPARPIATSEWMIRYDNPSDPFPTFDGSIREWPSFWAQFVALVDSNPRLSAILKFKRLLGALQGEAKEKARMFAFDEENYPSLKQFLVDEYGEPERLLELLREKIAAWPPLPEPCPYNDFSQFAVIAIEYLRDVLRYRPNTALAPEATVYMIRTKLPDNTITKWEGIVATLEERDHLEALSRMLQMEAKARRTVYLDKNMHQRLNKKPPRESETRPVAYNFATAAVATDPLTCPFCEQSQHHPETCNKELSAQERKYRVMRARRCLRCLGLGHMVAACTKTNLCKECQKPHHTLLHGAGSVRRGTRSRGANANTATTSGPTVALPATLAPSNTGTA